MWGCGWMCEVAGQQASWVTGCSAWQLTRRPAGQAMASWQGIGLAACLKARMLAVCMPRNVPKEVAQQLSPHAANNAPSKYSAQNRLPGIAFLYDKVRPEAMPQSNVPKACSKLCEITYPQKHIKRCAQQRDNKQGQNMRPKAQHTACEAMQ